MSLRPTSQHTEELLDGPEHELLAMLLDPSEDARALRQNSPFAGVLTDEERMTALHRAGSRAPRSA